MRADGAATGGARGWGPRPAAGAGVRGGRPRCVAGHRRHGVDHWWDGRVGGVVCAAPGRCARCAPAGVDEPPGWGGRGRGRARAGACGSRLRGAGSGVRRGRARAVRDVARGDRGGASAAGRDPRGGGAGGRDGGIAECGAGGARDAPEGGWGAAPARADRAPGALGVRVVLFGRGRVGQPGASALRGGQRVPGCVGAAPPRAGASGALVGVGAVGAGGGHGGCA